MRIPLVTTLCLALVCLAHGQSIPFPGADGGEPKKRELISSVPGAIQDGTPLSEYTIIQFIASAGSSPQGIMQLDNNREILMFLRNARSREQLRNAGVLFSESQLKLLSAWRLISEDDEKLSTSFPIIDDGQSSLLRERTKAVAVAVSNRLRPKFEDLVKVLKSKGREKNAYSILFSYVVDGLIWDEFERRGMIDPRIISAENPHWAGEVWAIHPPRPFSMGTNSISDHGVRMSVNWTKEAIPKMLPFVTDFKNLSRLFDDFVSAGIVENEEARTVFGKFGFFDGKGRITVPVIVSEESDPLYRLSVECTAQIAEEVPRQLDLDAMVGEFGFRDRKQALIVAYHEMMWDLMENLEAEHVVKKPVVFSDPGNSSPSDVSDLIFFVVSKK